MNEEEHYFTIKEAAKLLGVPKASIKRRIESKMLGAHKRLGKRGRELVIPQRALSLEIMSLIPGSRQLTLCEFETIVIKRFEAMAAGRDRRVSLALKELCEEFVQLRAEINAFNGGASEQSAPARARSKDQSSKRRQQERIRSPLPQPPHPVLGFSKNE
jgi:excisionase family DNA binding protein